MPASAQHSPPLAAVASAQPVHYANLPLNRAAELRSQPDQLQTLLAQPSTLLLPLKNGRALVGPAEVSERHTSVQLKLSNGETFPLTAINFASLGSSAAVGSSSDGCQPKWLPLVIEGATSGGALEAALSGAVSSSTGYVFLGLTHQQHAVFACELSEAGTVVAAPSKVSEGSSGSSSDGTTSANTGTPSSQELRHGSRTHVNAAPEGLPGGSAVTTASAAGAAAPAARDESAASSNGSSAEPAATPCSDAPHAESCVWADVRVAGQAMTGPDAAVLALATGLAKWHASAAFCGRTGQPLVCY